MLILWSLPVTALAQSSVQSPGEATVPTQVAPPTVVAWIGGETTPEATAVELEEALRAQLASLTTTVVVERGAPGVSSEAERLARSRELADTHDAVLVYWVERGPGLRWTTYAWNPRSGQLSPRTVLVEQHGEQAAIEAVAVIARDATAAVLQGLDPPSDGLATGPTGPGQPSATPADTLPGDPEPQPGDQASSHPAATAEKRETDRPAISAPPAESPDEPGPTPDMRDPAPIDLWVGLGYRGQNVGDDLPWDSGLALQVAWQGHSGLLLGAEYAFHPPADVGGGATFNILRFPLAAFAGYRMWADPAYVAVTAAVLLDVQHHSTPPQPGLTPEDADTRVRVGLAPGFRMELPAAPRAGFFVALDMAIYVNNFMYITIGERGTAVVLELHRISARFTTGIWLGL